MKRPEMRCLSSMRARMTIGFVFILAPSLWFMSVIVPLVANRVTEVRDQKQVGWIVERVSERMAEPDWQARLNELVATQVPKESHLALLIVDQQGKLLWRSPGPGPAWPTGAAAKLRQELQERGALDRKKSAARFEVIAKLPAEKAPEIARAGWGPDAEAKSQAAARALAEAKIARKLAPWTGKPADDWHPIAAYGIGPKGRRLALVIFQSWGGVMHEQAVQKLALLLLSGFAVLAVAGGAWLLVGRTLSPIRRLALQAGAASVEHLQVSLKPPSRDAEVIDLVDTLNGLLSRLAETAAVKGRFYAAASHELRTPLQALSGHLEVALSRERTAEEYERFLQEANKQAGRLTSLVQGLLLLHQLDVTAARAQDPVDLAEVCAGVFAQLAPLIDARGLRLAADLPPGIRIQAVPTHAEILVRNLLENAIKYAAPKGEVSLHLTAYPEGVRLEVFNECPPVPGGNPEKLFEPFYRPDAARNTRTGGNGLGLAICRAIAAANGWTVTLQQEPRGVRAVALFSGRPAVVSAEG